MGRKLEVSVPFLGGAGSPSNTVARVEAYLHAMFNLDPCSPLTTLHQRYRQTDRQRSDRIGRTVLQTVAQNRM